MLADLLGTLDWIGAGLDSVIFVLLPLEILWLVTRRELGWARTKEMLANATTFVPIVLVSVPAAAFVYALYQGVAEARSWSIPTQAGTALLCLLLVDFLYYWDHRLAHRIRGLWALYHSVHHSSPVFDQTTALRIPIVDALVSPFFYLPAVALGFDPILVIACFGIVIAYQTWLHTEIVGRLGWFDRIFNSPSNHRVHHAIQAPYLDRNYGAILIVWDRLFGTYAAEVEKPIYGLTEPIESVNPLIVHGLEIGRYFRDCRQYGWRHAWALFWRRPGWQPKPSRGKPI